MKKANLVLITLLIFGMFPFAVRAEVVSTNDLFYKDQYYLTSIHAQEAWTLQSNASAVVVAVIDDGVYSKSSDIGAQIWTNQKEIFGNNIDDDKNGFVDDTQGWDFISNDPFTSQVRGSHGTRVAGILSAMPNNGMGIAGVARNLQIMPLIVCDSRSGCDIELIPKAIKYAVDNGANVINMSIGGTYSDTYNDLVKYAYDKGVVLVVAAGNQDNDTGVGQNLSTHPLSPVCNDNGKDMVLGVSAVGKDHNMIDWAATGFCVDVVAPGEDIMSSVVAPLNGVEYAKESGTSFATPMVSAAAALLKAKYPAMTNRQIIDTLKQTADHNPLYKDLLGNGLIDIYKALSQPVLADSKNVNANNVSAHPDGAVVLGKDGKTVYVTMGGRKRGFATPEEYNSHGFVFSDIIKANDADLNLLEGDVVPFADGTLVLDSSDGKTIYMIDDGTKRGFASAEVFNQLGYSFGKAVRGNLSGYVVGTPIISGTEHHPAGAVVRDGSNVYKIYEDGKARVLSQDVLDSWHWDNNKIVNANQEDIKMPLIGIMSYRDGTLVKSTSGGIYVASSGELRPISSMEKFLQLGYKLKNVKSISDDSLYMYKIGAII